MNPALKRTVAMSALMAIALSVSYCTHAAARDALVIAGIGGRLVAPLTQIETGLARRGYRVIQADWFAVPAGRYALVVGHSAGADAALRVDARKYLTIDPTWVNQGCLARRACINWYQPLDAFPLIVCCGGYKVTGAVNRIVPGPHVTMPERIYPLVLKEAPQWQTPSPSPRLSLKSKLAQSYQNQTLMPNWKFPSFFGVTQTKPAKNTRPGGQASR